MSRECLGGDKKKIFVIILCYPIIERFGFCIHIYIYILYINENKKAVIA